MKWLSKIILVALFLLSIYYVFMPPMGPSRSFRIQRAMRVFLHAIDLAFREYKLDKEDGEVPRNFPQTLDEAIEIVLNSHYAPMIRSYAFETGKDIESGKDRWGNDLIYEFDQENFVVTLRSFGPNGKDDNGQKDDIVVSHDMLYSSIERNRLSSGKP